MCWRLFFAYEAGAKGMRRKRGASWAWVTPKRSPCDAATAKIIKAVLHVLHVLHGWLLSLQPI